MDGPVEGFAIPVHRALTEPILLGGAPRAIAIVNGTVAAALGLGLPSGPRSAIRSLSRLQDAICASQPI